MPESFVVAVGVEVQVMEITSELPAGEKVGAPKVAPKEVVAQEVVAGT